MTPDAKSSESLSMHRVTVTTLGIFAASVAQQPEMGKFPAFWLVALRTEVIGEDTLLQGDLVLLVKVGKKFT